MKTLLLEMSRHLTSLCLFRVWLPFLCILVAQAIPSQSLLAQAQVDATVLNVVDGDTLRIRMASGKELLRLIGIDTPESRINKRAEKQAARTTVDTQTIIQLGERATETVRKMVPVGTIIKLEFDVERRDHYGRLLGYAYLPDGSMLNEKILSMGYGKLLTVAPNLRHLDRLRAAASDGRAAKRGLWSMEGFAAPRHGGLKPISIPPILKRY